MKELEAKVTWVEDRRFIGLASSGHAIVVDGSAEKQGPSPMELLLIGMAGCTAYDVIGILQKKRQAVTSLEVSASAVRADEPPRVYTAIEIEYLVRGRDVNPKAVEDAIRLSKETYCSASIMLGKTARITTSYRIDEEG
ncbi:MAG TPA: OsmC family protein [Anaerolineae bacterium]|nr:OsmC family protein [Anaerolineae bacterium]